MKILCKNSCVFENKHFSFSLAWVSPSWNVPVAAKPGSWHSEKGPTGTVWGTRQCRQWRVRTMEGYHLPQKKLTLNVVPVRFVVKTFLQNLLYLYYHKFPVFFLDHKIMTKLSGKRRVFAQVGIHNTSRKIHLSKLNFAKIKTNNIRMKYSLVRPLWQCH